MKKPIKITNILKDGSVIDDLRGVVVKYDDCPGVYYLMDRLNREASKYENMDRRRDQEIGPGK